MPARGPRSRAWSPGGSTSGVGGDIGVNSLDGVRQT